MATGCDELYRYPSLRERRDRANRRLLGWGGPGDPPLACFRVAPTVGTVAPPQPLADGLERVQGALLDAVAAEDPFLTEVAGHLIKAGGKRQRPAFAMAAALTAPARGRRREPAR